MTLSLGPKLGMLVDGAQGETHYVELMRTLRQLDALIQLSVITHTAGTPPGAPSDGDVYIIPQFAGGDWTGHDLEVARWSNKESAWEFYAPRNGWIAWSVETNGHLTFTTTGGWAPFSTGGGTPPGTASFFDFVYGSGFLSGPNNETLETSDFTPGPYAYGVGNAQGSGKRYIEFSTTNAFDSVGSHVIGFVNLGAALTSLNSGAATDASLIAATSIAWLSNGDLYIDAAAMTPTSGFFSGLRLGLAVDLDADQAWLMLDGVAVSGDPAAGTGGYGGVLAGGDAVPFAGLYGAYSSVTIHSEAGDQFYSPPSGFIAWMA